MDLAIIIFIQCLICELDKDGRPTTTVYTIILFIVYHLVQFGDRDEATGLLFDATVGVHSATAPTFVAHDDHARAVNTGWSSPYATSVSQFDPGQVSGRVQLRLLNFAIKSWRRSALQSCISAALPMLEALLNRIQAHGQLQEFTCPLVAQLPTGYGENRSTTVELGLLDDEHNLRHLGARAVARPRMEALVSEATECSYYDFAAHAARFMGFEAQTTAIAANLNEAIGILSGGMDRMREPDVLQAIMTLSMANLDRVSTKAHESATQAVRRTSHQVKTNFGGLTGTALLGQFFLEESDFLVGLTPRGTCHWRMEYRGSSLLFLALEALLDLRFCCPSLPKTRDLRLCCQWTAPLVYS